MTDRRRAKRVVAAIYSFAADRLYDPLVVKGGFRILGGKLPELVDEAGTKAAAHAGDGPVLDMPVGTGHFTLALARRHGGIVVGADIATGMVERTRRDAAASGIANVAPLQADAHRLPFPDGTFPAIVCANGLQVIPGLHAATAELARVLAPGGALFVTVLMLPVGAAVPAAAPRLPTLLRDHRDVVSSLERHGLVTGRVQHSRLAHLIEARKPAS